MPGLMLSCSSKPGTGRLYSTNPFARANVSLLGYFRLNQLYKCFVRHSASVSSA